MKRLVNASKNFVLMMVKMKNDEVSKSFEECDPKHKSELIDIIIFIIFIDPIFFKR